MAHEDSQTKSTRISGDEAFARAMRIKLENNRRLRALRDSEKSPQPSEPSATEDINSEEVEERLGKKRLRGRKIPNLQNLRST